MSNIDSPIYLHVTRALCSEILSGKYNAGNKIPSVRYLAKQFDISPNTMQKAMINIRNKGLIYNKKTLGWFVTDDICVICDVKEKIIKDYLNEFIKTMKKLGFSVNDIINAIKNNEDLIT